MTKYNDIKKHLIDIGVCKTIGTGIYYCMPKDKDERLTLVYFVGIEYIFFNGKVYTMKIPPEVYTDIKMYLMDY